MTASRGRNAGRVLLAGVLLVGVAGLVGDYLDDGASWVAVNTGVVLYEGREMAEGARLYVDWRDTNPPSIYLLTAAVARGALTAGLPVTLSFYLATVLLGTLGLWILARGSSGPHSEMVRQAVMLGYVAFLFHPLQQPLDFAEREHLFALLFVPAVLFVGSRKPARNLDLLWLAALGFLAMMKPHFLAGVLAAGAAGFWYGRRFSKRQLGALAAGTITPLVGLWLHSAESFTAFFREVIPLHVDGIYGRLREPWSELPSTTTLLLGLISVAVFAVGAHALRAGRLERRAAAGWAAAWFVMAAGAIQQQKFWDYHFVPVAGLLAVAVPYLVATSIEASRFRSLPAVRVGFVIAVGAVALSTTAHFVSRTTFASRTPMVDRLLTLVDEGEGVLALSTHVPGIFDPDRRTVRALGPWPGHFRLPHEFSLPEPARSRALETHAAEVRQRIMESRPGLILMSTSEWLFAPGVSAFELLGRRHPVLPEGSYRRVPDDQITRLDLVGWTAFRRVER